MLKYKKLVWGGRGETDPWGQGKVSIPRQRASRIQLVPGNQAEKHQGINIMSYSVLYP